MSAVSFENVGADELIEFAYECSALLLSALNRECPSIIKKEELHDVYNGVVIKRDFRNNFQDPYNLQLLDKLIFPIFVSLLDETKRRGMATAVQTAFGKEGMYAIEVLGGSEPMAFEEISRIVHSRPSKPHLTVVGSALSNRLA